MKRIIILLLFIFCIVNGYSQDKTDLADYSYLIFKTPVFVNSGNISQIYNTRIDWGTCFFIRVKARLFLVTARHVVDKVQTLFSLPNALTDLYKPNQLVGDVKNDSVQLPMTNPYLNSNKPLKLDSQFLAISNWADKSLPVDKQQNLNFGFNTSQIKIDSQFLALNNIPASQIQFVKNDDKPVTQPVNNSVFDGTHFKIDSQYLALNNLPSAGLPTDKSDPTFQLFSGSTPLSGIPLKMDSSSPLLGNIQANNFNLDSLLKNLPKSDLFQANPNASNPNLYSNIQLASIGEIPEYLELRYYDSSTKQYEFCEIQYDPQISYGYNMTHPDIQIIEVTGLPKTAVINSIEKFLPEHDNDSTDEAFFWGYPQDNRFTLFVRPLTPEEFFIQKPSLYTGQWDNVLHTIPAGVDKFYYVLTPQTFKGASGSPIFFINSKSNGKGKTQWIEFAGVQSAVSDRLNTTYAVKADEVLKMLDDELKN